jgi:Ca2+-transporting ATPase
VNKTMTWHILETTSAIAELDSSTEAGLSAAQVKERVSQYGVNELIERGGRTSLQILWEQVSATMVLVLIGAAVLASLLDDTKSMIAILSMVVLYAFLGFFQEYRAEQAILALKKMQVSDVSVLRNGKLLELPARDLVPGDIVQLETGIVIPADMRLLEAVNLRIQEAALTGESDTIEKHTAALSGEDLPLGDRRNMGYMGTIVTQGRGLALVVATGMKTELGRIADLIQEVKEERAPLQRRLDSLGKTLAIIGFAIIALIFVTGLIRGGELNHIFSAAVSVAVAILPESLPAVVTITLALGAQRMFEREVLIRKLPAVETLGSVTVICSDKTGILTENRMTVIVLDIAEHALDLTEEMKRGGSLRATRGLGAPVQSSLSLAAIGGALCNNAKLIDTGDDHYHTMGDPTEGAIVVAAAKMGYWKSALDSSFPRAAELPFDSERKRMTTVHHLGQYDPQVLAGVEVGDRRYIAFTKGSVEGLLDLASHVWVEGKAQKLDAEWRSRIEAANERLAKKGMRVLGVAFRLLDAIPEILQTDLEQNLTLVGSFGMVDPPRAEVGHAVTTCRAAGIRPVMITSDDPSTAIEIARQLGITERARALTGLEIEHLSFDELKNVVDEVSVFARVEPEHKLKIVQALQARGHIVAMTGEEMNDAPALRKADIGVAMGISGTDVSREASDMVLFDDSFVTIVSAVREGRTVYDNIRKFVSFNVAGNIGKGLVMLLTPFLGKALPLIPLQLLWLNLIIDGPLGVGIGVENPETDTMKRPPGSQKESVLSGKTGRQTIWVGVLIGALAAALGSWYYFGGRAEWQTMIFTSLAFMQIFQALALRSAKKSLFQMGLLSNPLLLGMAALAVLLQLIVLYSPAFSKFFEVTPLRGHDLSIAAFMGVIVFIGIEISKRIENRR